MHPGPNPLVCRLETAGTAVRGFRRAPTGAHIKKGRAITVAPTPLHRQPHRRALVWIVGAFALVVGGVGIGLVIDSEIFESSSSSKAAQGSGVAATETREVPSFTGIELAGGNNMTIRVGEERSVVVHGDDNLLSRITTQVEDGGLVVGQTPGSIETKSPTWVEVSVPSLDDLTLTGSGILSVTGIEAETVTVTLSGSGIVRASGTATKLDVDLPGSGEAELKELVAGDVNAVVSGSGLLSSRRRRDWTHPSPGLERSCTAAAQQT